MIRSGTELIVVQGRSLLKAGVGQIRRLIDAHPEWTRRRLAIELCANWDWRNPGGHTKDMSCRNLLLELHRQGLIELPVSTRRPPQLNGRIDLRQPITDIARLVTESARTLNGYGAACRSRP